MLNTTNAAKGGEQALVDRTTRQDLKIIIGNMNAKAEDDNTNKEHVNYMKLQERRKEEHQCI